MNRAKLPHGNQSRLRHDHFGDGLPVDRRVLLGDPHIMDIIVEFFSFQIRQCLIGLILSRQALIMLRDLFAQMTASRMHDQI